MAAFKFECSTVEPYFHFCGWRARRERERDGRHIGLFQCNFLIIFYADFLHQAFRTRESIIKTITEVFVFFLSSQKCHRRAQFVLALIYTHLHGTMQFKDVLLGTRDGVQVSLGNFSGVQVLFKGILRHIWVIRKAVTNSPLSTHVYKVLYVLTRQCYICVLQTQIELETINSPAFNFANRDIFQTSFSNFSYLSPLLSLWWGIWYVCSLQWSWVPKAHYKVRGLVWGFVLEGQQNFWKRLWWVKVHFLSFILQPKANFKYTQSPYTHIHLKKHHQKP